MRVAGAGPAAGDLRLCPRYNGHTRDAYFSVGLQGVAEADVARVRDIIDRTLDDVIACVRPCAAPASAPPRPRASVQTRLPLLGRRAGRPVLGGAGGRCRPSAPRSPRPWPWPRGLLRPAASCALTRLRLFLPGALSVS